MFFLLPLMEALVRGLGDLSLDGTSGRDEHETKLQIKRIREILEKTDRAVSRLKDERDPDTTTALLQTEQEGVRRWCERLFSLADPPGELVLLAWQLLMRIAPPEDAHCPASEAGDLLMIVGRERARLIYGLVPREQLIGLLGRLRSYLEDASLIKTSRLITSSIVEMAERICAVSDSSQALLDDLLAIVRLVIWQPDELILNKARSLLIALFRRLRAQVNEVEVTAWEQLCVMTQSIEEDVKLRYLLLKDLLEADIAIEGFTDLSNLSFLLRTLISSKALAPVISDCVTLLVTEEEDGHHLCDQVLPLMEQDRMGLMGTYLFPRLVKRLAPAPLVSLLQRSTVEEGTEGSLVLYCSIYHAILASERADLRGLVGPLCLPLVGNLLRSAAERFRLLAFACLCKSASVDEPYEDQLGMLISTHLMDMMLLGTSDSRQQSIAQLKHLGTTHYGRLYKLIKIGETGGMEAERILLFWGNIIDLCKQFLSASEDKNSYNKYDLSLGILTMLVALWIDRLRRCPVPVMRSSMERLWRGEHLMAKLVVPAFIRGKLVRGCLLGNTFDTVRGVAAELIGLLCEVDPTLREIIIATDSNALLVKDGPDRRQMKLDSGEGHPRHRQFICTLLWPRLADTRTHIVDGATRMLRLLADLFDDHHWIGETLRERTITAMDSLDPAQPMSLAQGMHLLGGLGALQTLRLDPDLALQVMATCRQLCLLVLPLVSHPSPEGHSPLQGAVEEGEDDDGEEYLSQCLIGDESPSSSASPSDGGNSFAAMTFCWRAIKVASTVLTASLRRALAGVNSKGDPYGHKSHQQDDSSVRATSSCGPPSEDALTASPSAVDLLSETGIFLVDLLMRIRHPGAFMSLGRPLRETCDMCSLPGITCPQLPAQLLKMALDICAVQPAVQTTRRSAGLPICIANILTGTSGITRTTLIDHTMSWIELDKTISPDEVGARIRAKFERLGGDGVEDGSVALQVHKFNILRQLLRESALAEAVSPYLPAAFVLCSAGLGADRWWSIRNSALLTFTALLSRTFGIRHEVEDYAPGNCLDARTVWARHGTHLSSGEDAANWAILQRYRFAAGGEEAHGRFYRQSVSFALARLGSSRMKERRMTVRLLVHMAESGLLRGIIREHLERTCQPDSTDLTKANYVHGLLLLVEGMQAADYLSEQEARQYREAIPRHYHNCYPIRVLMMAEGWEHEEAESGRLSMTGTTEIVLPSLETVLRRVQERTLNYEQIPTYVRHLIHHGLLHHTTMASDWTSNIMRVFESFWTTDYDLEGTYRKAIVKAWDPEVTCATECSRLWYLAITDDEEEIREMACRNFSIVGRSPGSVASHLRFLLSQRRECIDDLRGTTPHWLQGNRYRDLARERLFEPEPLNCFRDSQWEGTVLSQTYH